VAYEVEWAESATAGLVEAVEYIARDSPSYAATLAVRAERAAASLSELPRRGRLVREYNDPAIREIFVGKSYRLIYRVETHVVSIIAFVHTARDLAKFIAESTQ
jgi:plasmid stabilization system protein ParE